MDQLIIELSGILPVLPSPFQRDGAIDIPAMRRTAAFARSCGVAGVVFPGFASEVSELAEWERRELLSAVAEELDGRVPLIAGGTAQTASDVVRHGRHASEFGVSFLMVQPPLKLGNDTTPVLDFFTEVASGLPAMGLILQNAPAPRGSDLSAQTILELAAKVPQIVYVKEETLPAGPTISAVLANRPPSLLGVIGGGGARYILDEYARGACAAMPALEIADVHVQLDTAWRTGPKEGARQLYVATLPLLALQAVYRMRLTKHVLMRRGVLTNTLVRAPTPELDSIAIADIDENLRELGLLSAPARVQVG